MSTIAKTPASYLIAIVAAEYIFREVEPGTHDWNMFINSSELKARLEGLGVSVLDISDSIYNPVC
jgi:2-polyprenyl-3-methyl-5-hydroxy-6-metoxy-1,4-benzoquinol methylase